MRHCHHILRLSKACPTLSQVSQTLLLCCCSPWKGLFSKPKNGKNIWLFTFLFDFCFHLFTMLWGSASRFFLINFRSSSSLFCSMWIFLCVACATHNLLSFTSLAWDQAVAGITSWVTLQNFRSPEAQVWSEWFPFETKTFLSWHQQKRKNARANFSQ